MAEPRKARPSVRAALETLVLLGIPAGAVGAVYLWTYVSRRFAFPVGYDTPKYLWRSALVASKGVSALVGAAPEPFRSNPDRPGFPILVDSVSAILRVTVPHLVMVLPAVMAATIGLGAGSFARLALRFPRWAVPVFVVAVGASANVSRMAGPGYDDNLVVTAMAMAAAAVAVCAANEPSAAGAWASAGAVLLLVAGVLTHWIFVALFGAILLAVAVLTLPASLRARRASRSLAATPSGRLTAIVGGSAVLGAIGLLTLVGTEPSPPRLPRVGFESKLSEDVPKYVFPVSGALATVGTAALWPLRRRVERRTAGVPPVVGAWLTLVWAVSGAAAVVLLTAGASLPAHRFLAFDLGIPLLVAAGITWVAGLIARRGEGGPAVVAVAVALVALAGTSTIAFRAWSGTHPWIPSRQFEQASLAGAYLQQIGGSRPVVFIVDLGSATPLAPTSEALHVIRTALPAADIPRSLEYLGSPDEFLAGRPTLRAQPPTFDQASLQHWPSVRAVLDEHPIALMMPAFGGFAEAVAAHPDWRVAPGLAVVQGPRPAGPYASLQPTPAPLPAFALTALWAAFLVVLAVTGLGWSASFVRAGWLERIALAPAFGIATIVLGGVLADRAGVRPNGTGGPAVIATVAVAGWGMFLWTARRRGRPQRAAATSV